MKNTTSLIIEEYTNVMNGYVAMCSYRMANLCIKAEPVSLLGVTVDVDGLTMNIEDVALVGEGENEYKLNIYPNDERQILQIGKAIAEEHIEFKQEMDTITSEDGREFRFIKLTMPEVNEDRKKFMTDAVKVLHDDCVTRMKAGTAFYTGKMTIELVGATKEEAEEAKKQFDKVTEDNKQICEDITKEKSQEIEDAYAEWVTRKEKEQQEKAESDAARGEEKTTKLKL